MTSSQDIASQPEFIRMGEIDRSISQEDYLPMNSTYQADHAEYLSMDQGKIKYSYHSLPVNKIWKSKDTEIRRDLQIRIKYVYMKISFL